MGKIRVTRVQTMEFEPNPAHYPPGITLSEIAEIDRQGCLSDPDLFFGGRGVVEEVRAEVLEGA